jgi:hypothetical protein
LVKVSTIRQSFRNLPLLMVSIKCWRQESSGSTFPTEAAMPPSAMTVWALPSKLFVTMPTDRPCSAAATAALRPAPPAPMIRTSCSRVSYPSRCPFFPSLCNSTTYPKIVRSGMTPA